ncbi:MAG: ATP-binding protein [Bacteroidota bacterium]
MYPSEDTTLYAFLTGIAVLSVLLSIYVYSILRHQRRRVNTYRSLRDRDNNLLEAERKRIAADLHDSMGSMLYSIRYGVETMQENNPSRIGETSLRHIDSTIAKMKEIAHNLVPQTLLKEGLAAAVKEFAKEIRGMVDFPLICEVAINVGPYSLEKQLNVFRIIQEIVSNSFKHAHASEIVIRITEDQRSLILDISDRGRGFDPAKAKSIRKFGLENIRSRIETLDARFEFETVPGKGTRYLFHINKKAME